MVSKAIERSRRQRRDTFREQHRSDDRRYKATCFGNIMKRAILAAKHYNYYYQLKLYIFTLQARYYQHIHLYVCCYGIDRQCSSVTYLSLQSLQSSLLSIFSFRHYILVMCDAQVIVAANDGQPERVKEIVTVSEVPQFLIYGSCHVTRLN